jgi:hypothetical protein
MGMPGNEVHRNSPADFMLTAMRYSNKNNVVSTHCATKEELNPRH